MVRTGEKAVVEAGGGLEEKRDGRGGSGEGEVAGKLADNT